MRFVLFFIITISPLFLQAQFFRGKALYRKQAQLMIYSKTLLVPQDDHYLLEEYGGGGGIFFGGVFRDTLYGTGDSLVGRYCTFYYDRGRYYIRYPGRQRKPVRFMVTDTCDPRINFTRNWHYKELKRYPLMDSIGQWMGSFTARELFYPWFFYDNKLCEQYCHSSYRKLCDSMYQRLLSDARIAYDTKAGRYRAYRERSNEPGAAYIRDFLNDFGSCRFDQELFYDLLLNHTALLLEQLNHLSAAEYALLKHQLTYMPDTLDWEAVLVLISESREPCVYKKTLLKDIGSYWRRARKQ